MTVSDLLNRAEAHGAPTLAAVTSLLTRTADHLCALTDRADAAGDTARADALYARCTALTLDLRPELFY